MISSSVIQILITRGAKFCYVINTPRLVFFILPQNKASCVAAWPSHLHLTLYSLLVATPCISGEPFDRKTAVVFVVGSSLSPPFFSWCHVSTNYCSKRQKQSTYALNHNHRDTKKHALLQCVKDWDEEDERTWMVSLLIVRDAPLRASSRVLLASAAAAAAAASVISTASG
jgi:hypothetical protein